MGVGQVTLGQVSLQHSRRGLLPLKCRGLFLDAEDPGGRRGMGVSREKARTDLRSPYTLSPESQTTGISKFWPTGQIRPSFLLCT